MLTCGIGIATSHGPSISYLSPTDGITATGTRRELAGLEFEFLYAPTPRPRRRCTSGSPSSRP